MQPAKDATRAKGARDAGHGRPLRSQRFMTGTAAVEGTQRARSHCRFVPPLIRFIPYLLIYSVPLYLKRRCDRTLGTPEYMAPEQWRGEEAAVTKLCDVRRQPC
jgi:hypothetical protein